MHKVYVDIRQVLLEYISWSKYQWNNSSSTSKLKKDLFKAFFFRKSSQKNPFCTEAASRGVLKKRVLQKFHQVQGKTPVLESFFWWIFKPEACNFIKKGTPTKVFPANFVKFSRTPFLQNTSRRILLFIIYLIVSFCKDVLYI